MGEKGVQKEAKKYRGDRDSYTFFLGTAHFSREEKGNYVWRRQDKTRQDKTRQGRRHGTGITFFHK